MRTIFFYFATVLDTLVTSFTIIIYSFFRRDNIQRKKFIYRYFTKYWGRKLFYYTGSKIEINGMEHVDPNKHYLVMVNHQSNFDIYILIGFLSTPLCFLSKIQNFKIPIVGTVMRRMGCISIDRSNSRKALNSLLLTARRYEEGMSIVIYPEGTRSKTGDLLPFKNGFLRIVEKIETPCYLLPVTLSGTRSIQKAGKLGIRSRLVRLDISPEVKVDPSDLVSSEKLTSEQVSENKKRLLTSLEETIGQHYEKDFGELGAKNL